MHHLRFVAGSVLLFAPLLALPASPNPQPDAPLIVDGPIVVDALDVDASLLRIPEERRAGFRLSYERVAGVADATFVARTLAARAREQGLDRDAAVQRRLQQIQEAFLADLYSQKLQKDVVTANLDQRVRELYKAEQEKFVTGEQVRVQKVTVDLKGRTREMALERAQEVRAKAAAGDDFLALAARYSDDPTKTRNGGNLGYMSPKSFPPAVQEAMAKLKDGEISAPVETDDGFSIVRVLDRKRPEPVKFEAVKNKLLAAEKERMQKQRFEDVVTEIRSSPTVVINRANVEALVIPIDAATTERLNEAHKAFEAKAAESRAKQ
jgi:parvulin-like peptidyl-prolyl isomerase